jgi:cell division protein FtsI (penicillin-binding protein 3)
MFPSRAVGDYKAMLVNGRHRGDRYQTVLRNVSYPQLLEIKTWPIFRSGRNKGGFMVKQIDKRLYPYDNLALRTIGYVNENNINAVGIEAAFNNVLTGTPGKQLMRKISGGVYMPLSNTMDIEPRNGKDIITTLDISLQDQAENALKKALMENNADHGSVIVMEVQTGKIKALANLGRKVDGSYEEIYNYAIGEKREPGSTFKVASVLALLEDGYVNLNDTIDVELGVHKYGKQIMKDAEEHGFRKISVLKAFAISSNVGISKLISKYYDRQPDRYLAHLHTWHLDQPLGIGIPGEIAPYIKNTSNKYWSTFSLPWMSVGYEIRESPINMVTLYNAIANKGVMVKPYLVSEIDEYGKPVQKFEPVVLNKKICSDSTLAKVRKMLEAVVNVGTATNLKNPYYSIAGKTGTAIITDKLKDTTIKSRDYQSSFCGFFPADNPVYTICVVINRPSKGVYYGARVAGPVFKEIADEVYANAAIMQMKDTAMMDENSDMGNLVCKGFRTDLLTIIKLLNKPYTSTATGNWAGTTSEENKLVLTDLNMGGTGTVPEVRGLGLRDAMYLLENQGLVVRVVGRGKVRQQSLKAGDNIKKGQIIILTLA